MSSLIPNVHFIVPITNAIYGCDSDVLDYIIHAAFVNDTDEISDLTNYIGDDVVESVLLFLRDDLLPVVTDIGTHRNITYMDYAIANIKYTQSAVLVSLETL